MKKLTKKQKYTTEKDLLLDALVVLNYLKEKTLIKYRPVESILKPIKSVLMEPDVDIDLCRRVIDMKVTEWGENPDFRKYLRPSTIFRKSNFFEYAAFVDAPEIKKKTKDEELEEMLKEIEL